MGVGCELDSMLKLVICSSKPACVGRRQIHQVPGKVYVVVAAPSRLLLLGYTMGPSTKDTFSEQILKKFVVDTVSEQP